MMRKIASRATVLVVDDVPTNVQILADALSSDYRIKVANNGISALEIARHEPQPDIILLDVMMPEMDGFEVCRRLKADPMTWGIPVVFVTARDSEVDEELGLSLGAIDYITKPFSIATTRARVRNYLRIKQQSDLLETLSLFDALTQISNRRRFDESYDVEWKRACRENTTLSLLMVDIDHFKEYNDSYGHGAGDVCLQAVATALASGVSRPGDLVARYGGEEFVVVLPETDLDAAILIAERLCQNVRDLNLPHAKSAVIPIVTVSIGCASLAPATCPEAKAALLEEADQRLYQAKHEGRNRIC